MVRRVFLHIGAPKTGTTALQTRLQGNAATLVERGVLVPMGEQGSGKRPAGLVLRAALELTGVTLGQRPEALVGEWDRLVEQVTSTPYETTVISHEAFVRCDAATAATAVRDLGAGAEAHVVYTARDLGRQLVSGWLEGLKNGGDDDLATHLARARSGDLPLRHAFDIPQVLGRWLDHVPAERIHLLTVPPPGGDRDLLWRRFADLVGLEDSWAPEAAGRTNESVGVPEAQLLLALNRALEGSSKRGRPHHKLVRRHVARVLVGRDSPRVEVPPQDAAWLRAEVDHWIAWTTASGIDVVGDLDELRPVPTDAASWTDPGVPHPGLTEAAVVALASVVAEVAGGDRPRVGTAGQRS
jgi:hypothetical protein